MQQNGSAVDAAVAASFCLGLFSMHSTGIGGGGLMVVYKRDTKTVESYDYRESAPGKSREDMYVDNPEKSSTGLFPKEILFSIPLFLFGICIC